MDPVIIFFVLFVIAVDGYMVWQLFKGWRGHG